jgi:hypothetical protein
MLDQTNIGYVSLAMAFLQIAVVIWKGGELNQRVKHLETKADRMDTDISSLKTDVSFIKGLLSSWSHSPETKLP